jgi:hypothetical protein
MITTLKVEAVLYAVALDPRFQSLLRHMGLTP